MSTYAGRFGDEPLVDAYGRPFPPGTTYTVYEAGTNTLATLYSDRDRTTTIANPTTIKANGNAGFWAEPNDYDILVGSAPRVLVTASVDADEDLGGGGGAHPDLATHNTLGLATQAELDAETAARSAADALLQPVATLAEAVDDRVAALLVQGTNVTLVYDDGAGTLTISTPSGLTQEQVEDIVAALTDDNSDLDWTYDDPTGSLVAVIKPNAVTNTMLAGSIDLAKLAVDPLARANHTGSQLAATISDFNTQVRTNRLDQMAAPTAAVPFNAQKITGLADPTLAQDAATRAWVLTEVAALVNSAPGTLDTLGELSDALGDDPNFATTVATNLAGKQPLDTDLTAIAALVSAANKMPYATGVGTWALADLSAFARTILDDADAAAVRSTLGLGTIALLNSIATANIGDDQVTFAKTQDIATARILGRNTAGSGDIEELTAATVRTLLGLVIGTNVQAWDADLDTWAGKTAPSGTVVGTTDTQSLTGKTMTDATNTLEHLTTEASNATPTPTGDRLRQRHTVTAQAAAAAFATPSGTPADGNRLIIRIKDNGTARALTWNAIYRAIGVTLPTTTVISKTLYVGAIYNSADSKWDVTAVGQEA